VISPLPIRCLLLSLALAWPPFAQAQRTDPAPPAKGPDSTAVRGPKKMHVTYYILDDGDSVPVVNLPAVEVLDKMNPLVVNNMHRYLKLKRDVLRAYPYAKLAANTLREINDSLATLHKPKQRKKYIKQSEARLKAQFEKDLRRLSVSQGRILLKLVNRETGDTSYEIVKDLRGPFNALFWQTMARFFGSSMKSEYDPRGEDRLIEDIVRSIENGEIPVVKR
jgi:hypothetical protein